MKIRQYLDETGLTLAAFAARAGVSEAAMSRYARGKRTPRPDVVRRIVAASGGRIEPNDLFELPTAAGAAESAAAEEPTHPPLPSGTGVVDLVIPDLNGTMRGKRIPADMIGKALAREVRLPGSLFSLDISGEGAHGTGLVWSIGDEDKALAPADGRPRRVSWADEPTALMLMTMVNDDGSPFFGDPRQVLSRVARDFTATGLKPVVAVELEFYLLDSERDQEGRIQPPRSPATGLRERSTQVYGFEEIAAYAPLFRDIAEACAELEVPATTAVSEYAPAQYEVNLKHVDDAVRAADDAVLLKHAVKAVARRHGFHATFMAKPFPGHSGNGLHLHLSLVDGEGCNVFDGGSEIATATLEHALGGLMATMADTMAIFAPNANSYRRLQPGAYAPLAPTWGIENRTVALRVPGGPGAARRIEHRVAGADANIHLVVAAMLAGIQHGLENRLDPGERTTGNAYEKVPPSLPNRWREALDRFDDDALMRDRLGAEFCRLYSTVKRFEMAKFEREITPLELAWYAHAV